MRFDEGLEPGTETLLMEIDDDVGGDQRVGDDGACRRHDRVAERNHGRGMLSRRQRPSKLAA